MNATKAIISGLNNYTAFSGRATRPEFWWFAAFYLGTIFVLWLLAYLGLLTSGSKWTADSFEARPTYNPSIFFAVFLFLPFVAALTRRLRDLGMPQKKIGWTLLGNALLMILVFRITVKSVQSMELYLVETIWTGMSIVSGIGALFLITRLVYFLCQPTSLANDTTTSSVEGDDG